MGVVTVHSGLTEPITVHLVDAGGLGVSGLSPTLTLRRQDTTSWWNGSAMVASGVELDMTEVSAAEAIGDYRYNFETAGADAAKYIVEVTPSSVSGVANLPATGALEVSLSALLPDYQGYVWIDALSNPQGGQGSPGVVVGVNGLQSNPVDSIEDARVIADALGIRSYRIRGSVDLDQEYRGWVFEGWPQVRGSVGSAVRLTSTFICVAQFLNMSLSRGGLNGSIINAVNCQVTAGHARANGSFHNCAVGGTWDIQPDGEVEVIDCYRPSSTSFWGVSSFFATSDSKWSISRFSGDITLSELVSGNTIDIGLAHGSIDLGGFNLVSGTVKVAGVGRVFGTVSPGPSVTVDTTNLVDPDDIRRLYGGNTRTRLYFPDALIVSGVAGATRDVKAANASHMEVQHKLEASADWSAVTPTTYYVVFNYPAGAAAGDAPRSAAIHQAAPDDGTFTTTPYEVE